MCSLAGYQYCPKAILWQDSTSNFPPAQWTSNTPRRSCHLPALLILAAFAAQDQSCHIQSFPGCCGSVQGEMCHIFVILEITYLPHDPARFDPVLSLFMHLITHEVPWAVFWAALEGALLSLSTELICTSQKRVLGAEGYGKHQRFRTFCPCLERENPRLLRKRI